MKVRIEKIEELENAFFPNNIPTGNYYEGYTDEFKPVIGERYTLTKGFHYVFSSSAVQEIIDENTFRTFNSIYKITKLQD